MNTVRYPRGKYDQLFIVVAILISIIFFIVNSFSGFNATLLFIILWLYQAADAIYKVKTCLLKIKGGILTLDRGFLSKKLSLEITNITDVEGFELNHEMIRLIFHLKDGNKIEYTPPIANSSELLEKIVYKINLKTAVKQLPAQKMRA